MWNTRPAYQQPYTNNTLYSSNVQQPQNYGMEIQQQSNVYSIKGKYVNSIDEVIGLQSSDVEPAICVDLSNNKMYIKTFNIDGSFKIEEFIKNENAQIDTRSQSEKLNDVVLSLAESVKNLTNEVYAMKSELGMGGNENV